MRKNIFLIILFLWALIPCSSCSSDDNDVTDVKEVDQKKGELEMIYSIADELDMKVICDVNLSGGSYYGKYAARDLVNKCDNYIKLYHNCYGHHASFWGWYINTEINPLTEMQKLKSLFWRELWKGVAESCHSVAPGTKVTISPFFILDQGTHRGFKFITPEETETWWYNTLKASGIDIVMLQDSGAEHLSFFTLAEREAFYKAFYNACRRTGKELWGNIETAEILARDWEHALEMERNGTQVWRFTPIDWLQEKIELAAQYATGIVSWGYYPYMDPSTDNSPLVVHGSGMDNTTRQANYNAYLEYQKRVPSTIPAGMKAQPKIKGTLWWFPTDLGSLDGKELETALRKEITNQKKIGFEYIWLVNACNHFVVK